MVLVIDVDFNQFKEYMNTGAAYFYTETTKAFVLIKPLTDCIIRTVVMKETPESDESFKLRHLRSHTVRECLNFTIDGVPVVPPVATEQPTEGDVDLSEKEPEEENLDGRNNFE